MTASDSSAWSLAQPNARRSLILCAVGAIAGLIVAGFGLFTAEGTRTSHVPPEDAAIVNQVPILMSDFVQQLRAVHDVGLAQATPAQKKKILDDMIREELYVQRGVELGMANDDIDVRAALVAATEAQTAADAMTAGATDRELRDYFAQHRATYASEGTMELGDWIVPAGRDLQAIASAVRGGATPASLGLTSSGKVDDGEEYYFAARIHLGPALFAAARGLRDGEVAAVAVGGQGHVLTMKRNVQPVPARFEQVRDHVLGDYIRERVGRIEDANGRFLRKRADIKIADSLR